MTRSDSWSHGEGAGEPEATGLNTPIERRRFVGFLVAGPTVAAAAWLTRGASTAPADAALSSEGVASGGVTPMAEGGGVKPTPATPQGTDYYDLEDFLTDLAYPTTGLVKVEVHPDGTVSYALPRSEVGQGITTAIAMLIAEEMDLPLDKVKVPLSDARPELMFNMFTGGSNSINSLYYPVRTAAGAARAQLMQAASGHLGYGADQLTSRAGVIQAPNGASVTYGELAVKGATLQTKQVEVELKSESAFTIVGKPTRRIDALEAVTGRKQFAMDLSVADAKPCMVCRPPTINGKPGKVNNLDAVKAMPGITDVVPISSGIAVRGDTFGQCIDAVNALQVEWGPGPKDNESDETVLKGLKAATEEMQLQPQPGQEVIEADFAFAFASHSPLEPNTAIADVKADRAEIWSTLKIPIAAQKEIAKLVGLEMEQVTVHVTTGGGSFGRRLFYDAALEAAEASKKMGKPVKLMWHRADNVRHGRAHPMALSRIRAVVTPETVVGYEQQLVSVRNDLSHGLGDIFTPERAPSTSGEGVSKFLFDTTQRSPYNFGNTRQYLARETHAAIEDHQPGFGFNTGSMRSVYSQQVCTAQELFVDMLAAKFKMDRLEFRHKFGKLDKIRTVLDRLRDAWDPNLAPGTGIGQGVAVWLEHKQVTACLVKLDCRPETVNREVYNARTGPRVIRAVYATVPGKVVVNPLGMEAQIQGGFLDGVAYALTASLHLVDGHFQEASWDNYAYTRQWNVPLEKLEIHILPPDPNEKPAGQGETSVPVSRAATACAYAHAMGQAPSLWPVAHTQPLHFKPYPTVPPLPVY
ncbi:MAG TPA: molybdopterin cofactor-binding domain-containing protein [Acidimicrobiia bacterium]|nr:molybdopterin cofactor-binding domain-containing protein [Acidimicrobiia bacterium]